ncbi:hypothetical protein M1373_00235 [Candidatus Marsarchaeota archaeon]|nr:hypothetical protein [Candidatus Marsarchaeota archaeon]
MRFDLEIECSNEGVRDAIAHAFSDAQANKNGNALFTGFKDLNHALEYRNPENSSIRIEYAGRRISYSLGIGSYAANGITGSIYYNSNEEYTKATMDDIKNISGLNAYLGISGGLTQIMTHMAALSHNNSIKEVKLCDKNGPQLMYNALQLARYDAMPESINPLKHIFFADSIEANEGFAAYSKKVPSDVHFTLEHRTLEQMVVAAEPKKYFVYSSNAFSIAAKKDRQHSVSNLNGLEAQDRGAELVNMLRNSEGIKNGSYLMAASANATNTLVLHKGKRNGSIGIYSYCYGASAHNECKHPAKSVD